MRAGTDLLSSEGRYELMLRLMAMLRETTNPEAMMQASAEAVCRFLNVDRAGFFEMRGDDAHFTAGWASGRLPPLTGVMPAAAIGALFLREVQAGRTLGISDTRTDPLTVDSRFGGAGTVSLIGVPIIRQGRLHAGFYVNHSEPREWTDGEVRLVRDAGEQTWDAAERAVAETARRESEQRLAIALEAGGGVGAWAWDIPGGRVFCNPLLARLFSLDADSDAAGAPVEKFVDCIHRDDRARVADHIRHAVETGEDFTDEYRVVQQDGSVVWVLARGRCQWNESGRPKGFNGVVIDITDRKRAEQQLLEQWRTFDTALSHTPDFNYIFDLDGRFTYVNRALLSLWQKPLQEALGKNFFDLDYPPELAERLQRQIQKVIDTSQPVRDHTPFTGPTGETRHYEYIFVPVQAANGQVEAVAGSTRDITERKQSEEQERERQGQLLESARLESLGVMAGGIAHDFNNLLVGILGNASLLVETAREDDRSIASDIVFAANRAADLTRQMLAYSGRGQFAITVFDLNTLIRENLTLLRASISRSISLDLEFASEPCFVEADRTQIQQVIMNLLINASEAIGGSPGVIAIRTARAERTDAWLSEHLHVPVPPGKYVLLEILDNGSGMTAETAKRIFDPFFTTKFTGRGLGLAAVLGIVKGHKGDIEVVSRPGAGATFRILLPACGQADSPARPSDAPSAARKAGQLILLVDDEEVVLRTASTALRSRGFHVMRAANGSEALDVLRAHDGISLVILDLTMPVMTGEQAIPLIKAIAPRVPILLSSGFSETELWRRFASSGIAGVLQKPYTVSAIITAVTRALQNPGRDPSPTS